MVRFARLAFLLALVPVAFAQERSPMSFALSSPAFSSGAAIPTQYSCKGTDISPALHWSNAPAHTASFAIVMDDPDAPAGTWVHWVLWNLPATAHSLRENVAREQEQLSDGAVQGRNSFRKTGYNGPCPPVGQTHRYFFRLYALDAKLDLAPGSDRSQLEGAMKGHVLGQAEYMATFHE